MKKEKEIREFLKEAKDGYEQSHFTDVRSILLTKIRDMLWVLEDD